MNFYQTENGTGNFPLAVFSLVFIFLDYFHINFWLNTVEPLSYDVQGTDCERRITEVIV